VPYPGTYCRFRLAEALLGAGRDGEVEAVLRDAEATASRLGAAPLLGELRRLARRAHVSLPGPARTSGTGGPGGELGLTPRELEVVRLLAAGRSNRQIADALVISVKTASVHVSNILAKLQVASRGEAGALARRLGLDGEAKGSG
jgi:DNA-binding NarL/FixJ family response regulator